MIHKQNNISVPFLIFMRVNMKLRHNNSLNFSLLKYLNLGVLLFILMISNLLLVNGLKEIRKILFLILSMSILIISISQYLNKFIATSKWDQENPQNKLISVIKSMLNFHFHMLIDFFKKKCMMKLLKYCHL